MPLISGTVLNDLEDGQDADAGDVTAPLLAIIAVLNGGIDVANLADDAITTPKIIDGAVTAAKLADDVIAGWKPLAVVPTTVTPLGQKSYTVLFPSVDYTSKLSKGMRLRSTRSVAAPDMSTSLNGTTQFYSKSSPNKCTFTDDFAVAGWVKLTSYAVGAIISRYNGTSGWRLILNADGTVALQGFNAGAANFSSVSSYQSVPLNKWVYISAQLDMSAFTATTTTSYIMLDGVDVPALVTRGGTNPTALVQPAADLQVGATNGGSFFPGKLAQVAYYTAKVTQATFLAAMNQTLAGNETNLGSGYSFDNSIADLNTTTPNDLTANGSAVATNADGPFAQAVAAGLLDYGIITNVASSTNTTVTVQVAEGSTLPTSGGIASAAYSSAKSPYLFPTARDKWLIQALQLSLMTNISIGGTNIWTSGIVGLFVPVGAWGLSYKGSFRFDSSASGIRSGFVTLSDTAPTNSVYNQVLTGRLVATASTFNIGAVAKNANLTLAAAATYLLYGAIDSSTGTETFAPNGSQGAVVIEAENAYL